MPRVRETKITLYWTKTELFLYIGLKYNKRSKQYSQIEKCSMLSLVDNCTVVETVLTIFSSLLHFLPRPPSRPRPRPRPPPLPPSSPRSPPRPAPCPVKIDCAVNYRDLGDSRPTSATGSNPRPTSLTRIAQQSRQDHSQLYKVVDFHIFAFALYQSCQANLSPGEICLISKSVKF